MLKSRPRDTLARCWGVKQQTNKQTCSRVLFTSCRSSCHIFFQGGVGDLAKENKQRAYWGLFTAVFDFSTYLFTAVRTIRKDYVRGDRSQLLLLLLLLLCCCCCCCCCLFVCLFVCSFVVFCLFVGCFGGVFCGWFFVVVVVFGFWGVEGVGGVGGGAYFER